MVELNRAAAVAMRDGAFAGVQQGEDLTLADLEVDTLQRLKALTKTYSRAR
ncbi:MAG: hypothetical protein ACREXU_16185 [Gammaproteobacteria bacterium]